MKSLIKATPFLYFYLFIFAPIVFAQSYNDHETEKILAAAIKYARAHSAPGIVEKSDFKVVKKTKDKALVLVCIPKDVMGENAGIIVKKIDGKWIGETMCDFLIVEEWFYGK